MLENNAFFFKNNGIFMQCFFDTPLHIIYFDYKVYAFYKKIFMFYIQFLFKTRSVIETQSYRPCYSRTLISSHLFCTSPLWHFFFLVVENHCVFLALIFWNCAFFPINVREKRKTQTKNYHCMERMF